MPTVQQKGKNKRKIQTNMPANPSGLSTNISSRSCRNSLKATEYYCKVAHIGMCHACKLKAKP